MSDNKNTQPTKAHAVQLDGRKTITVSGVEGVISFSPTEIKLSTSQGNLSLIGEQLKIIRFSQEEGAFSASGKFNCIRYGQNFLKSLFK